MAFRDRQQYNDAHNRVSWRCSIANSSLRGRRCRSTLVLRFAVGRATRFPAKGTTSTAYWIDGALADCFILDLDHDAFQAVVDGYWKAFDESGAFFAIEQKMTTVRSKLIDVGKKGKKVKYPRDGKEKSIKISRSRTKITIGGEKAQRKDLKAGLWSARRRTARAPTRG